MDEPPCRLRMKSWVGIAVCVFATSSLASSEKGTAPRTLPELDQHLRYGREQMATGNYANGIACAEQVLLSRDVSVFTDSDNLQDLEPVKEAAAIWQTALGGTTRFIFVSSIKDAQINVTFSDSLGNQSHEFGGYSKWVRRYRVEDNHWVPELQATIQLRTVQPGGKPMTAAQRFHAACHELGHILGLEDSARPGDIMGPLDLRKPASAPQAEEVDALKQIRQRAEELLVEAKSKLGG